MTIDVLANDTDANGDAITLVSVDPPAASVGTAGIVGGRVVFTPAAGFTGTATFTYGIADARGGIATGTVTVEVANQGPVAVDDTATTDTDTPVAIDVLENDSDPEGDDLAVVATTTPAHGTVVVAAGGALTYTPDPGYAGPDSFTYTVSDGNGGTATATVDVTVGNADPVAVDDQAGTPPGTPVAVDVLANDRDPNVPGTDQVLRIVEVGPLDPAQGTVRVDDGGTPATRPTTGSW